MMNKSTLHDDIKAGKVQFPFIAKPRSGFASRGLESVLPGKMPVAEDITEKEICLLLYPGLDLLNITEIVATIKNHP